MSVFKVESILQDKPISVQKLKKLKKEHLLQLCTHFGIEETESTKKDDLIQTLLQAFKAA